MARLVAMACLALGIAFTRPTIAEDAPVPMPLEAELLARVAPYDKNMPARARDRLRIVILTKAGNDDSARAMGQLRVALGAIDRIGGLPHDEVVLPFTGKETLASLVREQHVGIVFLTPGLSADVDAIRGALDGLDVLSVTSVPTDVPRGIVLGFDLVSGKPKLVVNLTQMRRQNVAFAASLLKLMRVFE